MESNTSQFDSRNLGEKVYEYLENLVIDGTLTCGQQLNIKQIAGDLNISIMPVRDAIKRLEAEGVVIVKRRSSCLLRVPTRESILAALDMRELLELYCMKKAAKTVQASSLSAMRQIVAEMKDVIGIEEEFTRVQAYIRLDRMFHAEICNVAGNEFATKFFRELSLHLNMTFIYGLGVPPRIRQTLSEHQKMLHCLEKGSAAGVSILDHHLRQSRENVINGATFQNISRMTNSQ